MTTKAIDPDILARLVNAYWSMRGVRANARAVEGEVVSDLLNGLPRGDF